jgi:hypothetical protein
LFEEYATTFILSLYIHFTFLDHNYSAILRTAEALGIQMVYMIDPPVVSMEEGSECRRDVSQKQITRTPEEIEQRRLHHLFAQNAVRT